MNIFLKIEMILLFLITILLERELFDIHVINFTISTSTAKKKFDKPIDDHLFEILTKEKDMNLPQSG